MSDQHFNTPSQPVEDGWTPEHEKKMHQWKMYQWAKRADETEARHLRIYQHDLWEEYIRDGQALPERYQARLKKAVDCGYLEMSTGERGKRATELIRLYKIYCMAKLIPSLMIWKAARTATLMFDSGTMEPYGMRNKDCPTWDIRVQAVQSLLPSTRTWFLTSGCIHLYGLPHERIPSTARQLLAFHEEQLRLWKKQYSQLAYGE